MEPCRCSVNVRFDWYRFNVALKPFTFLKKNSHWNQQKIVPWPSEPIQQNPDLASTAPGSPYVQLAYTVNLTRAVTSGCSFNSAVYSPVSRISGRSTIFLSTSLQVDCVWIYSKVGTQLVHLISFKTSRNNFFILRHFRPIWEVDNRFSILSSFFFQGQSSRSKLLCDHRNRHHIV